MSGYTIITGSSSEDVRFPLEAGAGSDAVHTNPIYAYAVCKLKTKAGWEGVGLAFTLGTGNDLVCRVIDHLAQKIEGREINELMSNFGTVWHSMAEDPNLRWLGPHKGVIHLALASVTNACFDLWAKSRGVPLWKLLIDLSAEEIINTLDLSYLEDELSREEAIAMIEKESAGVEERKMILNSGYPGYDTSVGWFNYSDEKVRDNALRAMDAGFLAMKLKVGSNDMQRDIHRVELVRKTVGKDVDLMLDANQQWSLPQAISICSVLKDISPLWIEEPTHPDDLLAHYRLAKEIHPIKLAMGEHLPNRVVFKNYLQSGCMGYNQVDALRVGGISEFITISLLSRKFRIPVVPHVGDMGQIHQHLVLFNHIVLGHEVVFLEHIPHLSSKFRNPVKIVDGCYQLPRSPGSSAAFLK
ncbi:MAG: mandelate racemase [Saprospiraceae bacterium]|nr:mandelate racemase [Saprospiraceae bacterium]